MKNESALNDSIFFHTAENMIVDLLHIFPEGILPYELGSVLYVYINVQKRFTIDQLNDRHFKRMVLNNGPLTFSSFFK